MADESPTIVELLDRARGGDPHELGYLFERCRNYVQFLARVQVETWLQAKVDASDLVQQTLLDAHRDFGRFRGKTEGEWFAWLRQILSHNAADFVRRYGGTAKRQVSREVALRQPADSFFSEGVRELTDPGDSPSQQAVRHERELQVVDGLSQLSEDYREVIILRNLERLSFDEVARRMGRSRPAVQMLWMRAIRKLQETLGGNK